MESENFLSFFLRVSHLSLIELHRCTRIQKDHQKIDHIHFTDYDPISASGWQRKHDFQLMSLTRLLLRITEQSGVREIAEGQMQPCANSSPTMKPLYTICQLANLQVFPLCSSPLGEGTACIKAVLPPSFELSLNQSLSSACERISFKYEA